MGNFKGRVDSALHKLSGFKSTKLSVVIQNTLSRLVILKNQRRLRCAHGRDDIAQLLLHGHHEIALVRVGAYSYRYTDCTNHNIDNLCRQGMY